MSSFHDEAKGLLTCVLCLMIPGFLALFSRVYVRLSKKAWGIDDWCMAYAAFPFFIECLSGILAAYYGLGQHEAELSAENLKLALLWWNIFSFFYCNSTLPIKLGINWQICRIASNHRKILLMSYIMMGMNSLTLLMVFIFQLAQCHPIAYNWDKTIPGGHCLDQKYLTIISFTMSGVNITTDWITACLPIFLLWNVQMNNRKKIGVGLLLSLGVLGSVAALVRLKYTVALNDATDFTFNLGTLACWTIAEPGLGYIAGNLATLRPLFRTIFKDRSTNQEDPSESHGNSQPWRSHPSSRPREDYHELVTGSFTGKDSRNYNKVSVKERRNSSSSILGDPLNGHNDSKPTESRMPGSNITVSHEVQITHEMV